MTAPNDERIWHVECGECDLADPFVFESETKDMTTLKSELETIRCRCGSYYNNFNLVRCLREDCEQCECLMFIRDVFPVHYKKHSKSCRKT